MSISPEGTLKYLINGRGSWSVLSTATRLTRLMRIYSMDESHFYNYYHFYNLQSYRRAPKQYTVRYSRCAGNSWIFFFFFAPFQSIFLRFFMTWKKHVSWVLEGCLHSECRCSNLYPKESSHSLLRTSVFFPFNFSIYWISVCDTIRIKQSAKKIIYATYRLAGFHK